MFPHPKTQQSILLVSERESLQDALSNYKPQNGELRDLSIFQPENWTSTAITAKLDHIYTDFAANVTRIFQRSALHLAIDLAFHSVLFMNFDGKTTKGWTELLVLGDSSQGKTEASMGMMKHYGLGERVECKNASVAGLLGGLQQLGGRWFVTWGVIPTHDKRLVVLEELKGANTNVISKLTDMRSSGIAEIPKIEKRRTHARTRLLALSNPRSDQPLSSYSFGVEAVKELVGGLEDVRRFDAVLMLSSTEIDVVKLNELQQKRPIVEHVYTADLSKRLILWAWSREPDEVEFTPDAQVAILGAATGLCQRFSDQIPIVDRGSMRHKLARLAAALACRTFSHAEDRRVVLIRVGHVEAILETLISWYANEISGYDDFSQAIKVANTLLSPKAIEQRIGETPFPTDFVDQLLHTNEIEMRDLCDWTGWDRSDALSLLSFLVRKHALIRDQRAYRKSPQFILLLKGMRTKIKDRPEYIDELDEF